MRDFFFPLFINLRSALQVFHGPVLQWHTEGWGQSWQREMGTEGFVFRNNGDRPRGARLPKPCKF